MMYAGSQNKKFLYCPKKSWIGFHKYSPKPCSKEKSFIFTLFQNFSHWLLEILTKNIRMLAQF